MHGQISVQKWAHACIVSEVLFLLGMTFYCVRLAEWVARFYGPVY
jgi:hypothetical protein